MHVPTPIVSGRLFAYAVTKEFCVNVPFCLSSNDRVMLAPTFPFPTSDEIDESGEKHVGGDGEIPLPL